MSIFSKIIQPFKDIVNGFEKSAVFIEKIFGEVIEIVKETIDLIESMINEIENLFNASKVEKIFLYPFEEAAFVAVGSVQKIFDLLKDISPTADGMKDFIIQPIDDVYKIMKSSILKLEDEGKMIISKIEETDYKLISTVENKFESFGIIIAAFPDDLSEIGERIKSEFKIEKENLFETIPEFGGVVKKRYFETENFISTNINTDVQSFKNIEKNIKDRLESESKSVDNISIFIFILIIIVFGVIFYFTKSYMAVLSISIVLIISFLIYIFSSFFA